MNFRHYELFQESRRICNAIYTHIIYSEYIPAIIGTEFAAAYDLLPRNLDQEKSDRKVRILKLFRRLKSRPFGSLSGTLGSLANHRECVRNLDLRVQVHLGELWVSKQRVLYDTLL